MKQDKLHLARLLAERLMVYKNTNTVVVAISINGIEMGCYLAKVLQLHFDILLSATIKHPSIKNRRIGSVCSDEVVINATHHDLPQDYIYHQVILHKHALKAKYKFYRDNTEAVSLTGKNVILISDMIATDDLAEACLTCISKKQPERIIMALGKISPEMQQRISPEVDDLIFLSVDSASDTADDTNLSDEEIRQLVKGQSLVLNL
jgi:predicted phosphoribosyltransferase